MVTAAMDTARARRFISFVAELEEGERFRNGHTAILVLEKQVPSIVKTTGDIAHDGGAGTRGFQVTAREGVGISTKSIGHRRGARQSDGL